MLRTDKLGKAPEVTWASLALETEINNSKEFTKLAIRTLFPQTINKASPSRKSRLYFIEVRNSPSNCSLDCSRRTKPEEDREPGFEFVVETDGILGMRTSEIFLEGTMFFLVKKKQQQLPEHNISKAVSLTPNRALLV